MNIQIFDYSVNLLQSILWQYNGATNLINLINQKQAWYTTNQSDFWGNWFNNVFNLLTADSFGLSVWSYILNVPYYIPEAPEPSDTPIFGFNLYTPSYPTLENTYLNFGNSNFSTKGQVIELTTEEQRFILRLRYFQLTTRGDITDINSFLNYLVNTSNIGFTGQIYALDGLDMTMTYVFTTSDISNFVIQVLKDLDILPRPAGVGIRYVVQYISWGFNAYDPSFPVLENTNENFNNGNFASSLTF